jgi:predicted ATP-grasp superfamily ATP-dependent carboligase
MAVLLTAAHSVGCLAAARALHARGVPVVVVGRPGSLAFCSRAVTRALVAPSSCNEPEAFARFVAEAARAHRVKVVMPLDDSSLMALDGVRPVLEKTARLALADSACLRVAMDKARLTETAARLGVPTPRSRLVTTLDEARAAAADLGYPVVVKPRASVPNRGVPVHLRFKVRFAGGWDGLEGILGRYLTHGRSLLLQEYCPGALTCLEGFCVEGTIVAVTQKHSAKTHPLTGFMDVVRTMVPLDPELVAQARRLLEGMRFEGLFNLQFRRSPRDGAPQIIDFNPRAGIFVGTVVRAGIDTPYLAYEWYAHRRLAPVGPYRPGARGRGILLDLRHTALLLRGVDRGIDPYYPSRARAVADFLLEFFRADHYDTFALADPLPALAEPLHRGVQGIRRAGYRVLHTLARRRPIKPEEAARQPWPSS